MVASLSTAPAQHEPERLLSLDAYRGAIMLLMASSGLGFVEVAKHFPDSRLWAFLAEQTEHAAWAGCHFWDLIQPAFMFMVGVAVPWSIAHRQAHGDPFRKTFAHALRRSLILILLALFLSSAGSRQTVWSFNSVLAQIGLGYPFLFLLAYTRPRVQWLAAGVVLVGYWLLFALHPLPPCELTHVDVGLAADSRDSSGFVMHWEKNANFGTWFDQWFLNLFPREKPYVSNAGGYQTLNFVPSLATMIFGLLAGGVMRSKVALPQKLTRLVVFGLGGVLLGLTISWAGLCPIVKRIWTPAWAIYSGGWVTLMLAAFVAIIDWRGWKAWAFPCVVAGLNPITLYCLWQLMPGFVTGTFRTHLGPGIFDLPARLYAPIVERLAAMLVFWLILFWMFRRKIFLRI